MQAHLATINGTYLFQQMVDGQTLVKSLRLEQGVEESEKVYGALSAARKECDRLYDELCAIIEGASVFADDPTAYDTFISQWNGTVKLYQDMLDRKASQSQGSGSGSSSSNSGSGSSQQGSGSGSGSTEQGSGSGNSGSGSSGSGSSGESGSGSDDNGGGELPPEGGGGFGGGSDDQGGSGSGDNGGSDLPPEGGGGFGG